MEGLKRLKFCDLVSFIYLLIVFTKPHFFVIADVLATADAFFRIVTFVRHYLYTPCPRWKEATSIFTITFADVVLFQ